MMIKKNKMDKANKLTIITITPLIFLSLVSMFLAYFTKLSSLESFRIVFGSIYVLFLPGFIISYIFFPKTKKFDDKSNTENKKNKEVFHLSKSGRFENKKFSVSQTLGTQKVRDETDGKDSNSIDLLERIALSFALSIAIVPLAVFYLNLIGIKINLLNSFLTILGIIVISLMILWFKFNKNRPHQILS